MKLKVPQFLTTRPAFLKRKPGKPKPQQLKATTAARRMAPAMEADYDEEPTTRLSSAFFVVLILHVVAVGGIYAFNSIKAHRRGLEPSARSAAAAAGAQVNMSEMPAQADRMETEVAPKSLPTVPAPALMASSNATASAHVYHVKAGDTLTRISQQTGVPVAELQGANNVKDSTSLRPGQTLTLPTVKAVTKPVASAAPAKTETSLTASSSKTYAVQKGDTATSIAKKMGVTVDELLKLNKVSDPKKLQLGQALKVPAKKSN